ncbi:MAG: AmmeMemoRadiSam system protein B [Magnetococcales bacterium]|nr:AmmeMemoRadiSam system protein B [Magnetococcales bacterium]
MLRSYLLVLLLVALGAVAGLFLLKKHLEQEVVAMNSAQAEVASSNGVRAEVAPPNGVQAEVAPSPGGAGVRVRPAAMAGAWYPDKSEDLASFLDKAMDAAAPPPLTGQGNLRAMIVPHAGYRFSGQTAASAFKLIRGRALRRVIVIGPSHRQGFAGISTPEVTHFATPLGSVPLDLQAIAALRASPLHRTLSGAHEAEHSIEIELPFLQRAIQGSWQLVPVLVGSLDPAGVAQIAETLRPLADDSTLVVVSSDFTHFGSNYGYQPFPTDPQTSSRIRELDQGAIDRILALDGPGLLAYKQKTQITACGLLPMAILLHMLGEGTTPTLLQYDTSGNMTHDYANSVSYVTMAFTRTQPLAGSQDSASLPQDEMSLLLKLARAIVHKAVIQRDGTLDAGEILGNVTLSARVQRPSGAFVTLKKEGNLRGCIGHIMPVKPLFQAVMENAVSAALMDSRFKPVTQEELASLTVEVSVLSPMRAIASLAEFRVGQHGIVLTKNGRRAVFLPEVATEQGWDRDTTLTQLAIKAGLPGDAWKEGASFEVFTTQTIHETSPKAVP